MFAWWGRMVYRYRYAVIGVMVGLCVGSGVYGMSLGEHVTQSGFYDEGSQSVHASVTADAAYGRDTSGHIIGIYTAPEGKTVDDPEFQQKVLDNLAEVEREHPDQILRSIGYFKSPEVLKNMADGDKQHAFMSIQLKGDNDDAILNNYNKNVGEDGTTVKDALLGIGDEGVDVQLAGLQPLAADLTGTLGEDQRRGEVAAIPLVCVVLFFVFGGVVAAALPGLIGGLTIAGALGIMRLLAESMPVHIFAQPVVTLIGLGIAIDFGLYILSRFREELAEGYDTEAAVRRTVMTSGRTVMFSAVIIVASAAPLLLFPQGFLKSITYAMIATVMLAAILSVSVLPALLAILGPRVDAIGVRWLLKFAQPDAVRSDPSNPRNNTLALASIPTGLLLPPVGIALGHLARKRIRQTGEQGAQFALIGLTLGYITLLGGLAFVISEMKDTLGTALYWVMLGIVIFVAVVIVGVVLARYVPLARTPIVWWLNWLAEKTQKTKTRAEVEKGFWGKLVNVVMKRPVAFAAPIAIALIVLTIPVGGLVLGGISEKYLPPDNAVRVAQEEFDKIFPGFRTEPLTLVIESDNGQPVTDQQIAEVRNRAMTVPGFIDPDDDPSKMWQERPYLDGASKSPSVRVIQNGLENRNDASKKIDELRALSPPRGLTISVGGTPALEQDSIHSLFDKLPLMMVVLIATTTVLMFLAFGSVVLPIKAAVMNALTLGATMGILTWMFVDGHGSGLMNYTPQPLMAPMIGMIIAIIWGLSTDYEVFLVSRMVEARERGMSTTEAIRIGTATTGRLISAAALVLAVVAGSFAFSDLVMMKYLAFGLLIALLLDATVIRMFLVPSIMKLLGDDCWWAPRWMKRIQERLGLGETELPDERRRPAVREPAENPEALVGAGAPVSPRSTARPRPPHDPTHPAAEGASRPGAAARTAVPRTNPPSSAGTTRMPTGRTPADEPQTTRLSTAKSAVRNVVSNAAAATRAAAAPPAPRPPREEREIESWLGELRGTDAPAGQPAPPPARGTEGGGPRQKAGEGRPSTASTRAMPEQVPPPEHAPTRTPGTGGRRRRPDPDPGNEPTTAIPAPEDADPTTAIPALGTPAEDRGRPQAQDPETATDKLNARDEGEQPKRRGGGMSAQDLLRREGRL